MLVEIAGADAELAHEIALHIAFAKPTALSAATRSIPALVERARDGFEELTRKEGKPEQAIPKIVEGRLNSWYAEKVLPEQGMFGEKETVTAAARLRTRSSGSPRRSSEADRVDEPRPRWPAGPR